MRGLFTLCLALASVVLPARAQDAMTTDRPGLGFSPLVVPPATLQIEIGLPHATRTGYAAGAATGTSTLLTTPALLRIGLAPRVEARVGASLANRASVALDGVGLAPDATSGVGDVEVGLKVHALSTEDDRLSNLSLIGSVVLPTGADGFSVGDPVITANAIATLALPDGFTGTLVAGGAVPTTSGAVPSATLVGVLGRTFTPAVSGYIEAGAFPTGSATPVLAGAGLAALVTPLLQLDAFVNAGLTDAAPDLILGIGTSFRFGR